MNKNLLLGLFLIAALGVSVLVFKSFNSLQINYSWIELGPDESQILRVIISGSKCPEALIDNIKTPLQVRALPDPENAPVLTCELTIPNMAQSVSLNGQRFKLKPKDPKKILVLGDTGCRIKDANIQPCDDPQYWPFAQVSEKAAQFNPDLIIHVGDYLYRQTECPEGNAGCEGSPFGNNYKTFDADFFAPAQPLLSIAPWVFVRGNHETCKRAGPLWDRFLNPYPYESECTEMADLYKVTFDDLQLLNVDTSGAYDYLSEDKKVFEYKKQFSTLRDLKENLWLVTHRPLYGIKVMEKHDEDDHDLSERLPEDLSSVLVRNVDGKIASPELVTFNRSLQQSVTGDLLQKLKFSLAGHFHNFEMLSFNGKLPPQIIAGNSATKLEADITQSLNGLMVDGNIVTDSKFLHAFGYLTMEKNPDGSWKQTQYNPQGEEVFSCILIGRDIRCK